MASMVAADGAADERTVLASSIGALTGESRPIFRNGVLEIILNLPGIRSLLKSKTGRAKMHWLLPCAKRLRCLQWFACSRPHETNL